jgi:hypothetical protein
MLTFLSVAAGLVLAALAVVVIAAGVVLWIASCIDWSH